MTTAIALETSRGDLPLALALGLILILLSLLRQHRRRVARPAQLSINSSFRPAAGRIAASPPILNELMAARAGRPGEPFMPSLGHRPP